MKKSIVSIVGLLLVGLVIGCQEVKKEEANAVKPKSAGAARRGCMNQVSYAFVKPDTDYGYGAMVVNPFMSTGERVDHLR